MWCQQKSDKGDDRLIISLKINQLNAKDGVV